MSVSPKDIVNEIQARIDSFQSGIPEIEKKAFREIQLLIKDLKLDATGNIRVSVENLRLITKAKQKMESVILSDKYFNNVSDLSASFDDITTLQTKYFNNTFTDFEAPKVINELKEISIKSTAESLSEAGINKNIIGDIDDFYNVDKKATITNILFDNISKGNSFADMNTALQDFIIGNKDVDSKLASYSKQVLTDSLSQYSRNYNKLATDDLGLQWYQYVGPLVAASRPICDALVKKRWIHKSELAGIARGIVDGVKVSTAGMISGTDGSNIQTNCGGYNCAHLMPPCAEEAVPKSVRIEMYKSLGIEYDSEGMAI